MRKKRLHRLASAIPLLLVAALLYPATAAAFKGTYAGEFNGKAARAELREEAGVVRGTLVIDGYTYRVVARPSGGRAAGELEDEAGVTVPLVMTLEGGKLGMAIYVQGANAPATRVLLSSAKPSRAPAGEIDPALVGHWAKSESYTSGDFSAAAETNIYLLPDGTYRFGASKLYGGGDAGSFGSEGGGGERGRWRTANRILYVLDAASGQWSAYARYYVEGNSALLTFGNGKREVWERRR
ncbi:MAG TPA: hypothetical protein VF211_09555 [Burkholderiales bacterium]